MERLDLAIAIWVANIVLVTIIVFWCNKKIKDFTKK